MANDDIDEFLMRAVLALLPPEPFNLSNYRRELDFVDAEASDNRCHPPSLFLQTSDAVAKMISQAVHRESR